MEIERGQLAAIPYAAVGSGAPLLVLAGLYPTTGVAGDGIVRSTLAPLRQLSAGRRIVVTNRWSGLPAGLTMRGLADGHAQAIRTGFDGPVDVVGLSTGGSIAQQLAADHPDIVRRLVVISSACRLGPRGRRIQARVATLLREDHARRAIALVAAAMAPRGLRTAGRAVGWATANRLLGTPDDVQDLIATLDAEDGFDLAQAPNPIQAPSLIIMGTRDRFYGAELARETAALIPNSHLMLMARRGHLTAAASNRAKAAVAGFLAR